MPYILCELIETLKSLQSVLPDGEDTIVHMKADGQYFTIEEIQIDSDRNLIVDCEQCYL